MKSLSSKKKRAGQSLVEITLALPIMLIMISGLIEFGFALNQYLNSLDAAREAARFATDGDPLDRDLSGGATNTDCGTTLDFYMQVACIGVQTMSPVDFITQTDDVVISVFRVLSGTVIDRWPNCEPDVNNDCPFDASPLADTMGEWHLFGRGDGCDGLIDDDGDGLVDDGCGPIGALGVPEFCNPVTDDTCHPSRLTGSLVQSKLDIDAPDSAVLLVEVFYDYPHVMNLPWITPFVPNPLPLHTYTILPLPAAEPSLTITGTVTWQRGVHPVEPLPGVTINFNNGMTAITDADGMYLRTGLPSGWITWGVDLSGTDCSISTPADYTRHLTINDMYNMDFDLTGCIDVAATETAAAAATQTAVATNATATSAAATTEAAATNAAATQTAAAGGGGPATDTPTPTATATIDPGCSSLIVSPTLSQLSVTSPNPPNVQADGSSTVEVLVQVLNECGTSANMDNRTVTLSSSRPLSDTVSPGSVQTDGLGQASFFVTSTWMSDWDINNHDFVNSTFTAVADGVTITNTTGGAFMCVGGVEGTAVNADEVVWRFQNDTGIDRRLFQVDVSWSQPQDPSRKLIDITFDGVSVWSSASYFLNPASITNSDWLGAPSDRVITAGAAHDLVLTYNFSVTGGQTFTLDARWDNTSGASLCNSNSVTVLR